MKSKEPKFKRFEELDEKEFNQQLYSNTTYLRTKLNHLEKEVQTIKTYTFWTLLIIVLQILVGIIYYVKSRQSLDGLM